jgi:hypothetical protein
MGKRFGAGSKHFKRKFSGTISNLILYEEHLLLSSLYTPVFNCMYNR